MDKFEEFLRQKASSENEEFKLPESFESKLENTLSSLDNVDINKKKFKVDRRLLVMAASLMLITLVGVGYRGSLPVEDEQIPDVANYERAEIMRMPVMEMESGEEQVGQSTKGVLDPIIDISNIETITIEKLNNESLYKVIENEIDKNLLIDTININYLEVVETKLTNNDEWIFKIDIIGDEEKSLMIKDNFIKVNDSAILYRSDVSIEDKINEIYNSLEN